MILGNGPTELSFLDSDGDTSTIRLSTTEGGGSMSWSANGRVYLARMTKLNYESDRGRLVAPEHRALKATLVEPAAGPKRDALLMGLARMAKSAGDVALEGFPETGDAGDGKDAVIGETKGEASMAESKDTTSDAFTATVQRAHVAVAVVEMFGAADLPADASADHLLSLFDTLDVPDNMLDLWRNTSDSRIFSNSAEARKKLKLVTDYSEESEKAGPGVKNKVRLITQVLTAPDGKLEPTQLLLLLASHGGVCNVMKEVGIATCYGLVTDNVRDEFERATLEQQVLRNLRDLRVTLVEEEYKAEGIGTNNAHPLIEYVAGNGKKWKKRRLGRSRREEEEKKKRKE